MTEHRPAVKKGIKRRLLAEAGGKCANPGCTNTRVHIHHIMEWHIYGSHDPADMIAVCPSCHDEIHHGRLGIPDETLYAWKQLQRQASSDSTTQLYVEPAQKLEILCGSITLSTNRTGNKLVAFKLSNASRLGFKIEDNDMLLVNLQLNDRWGIPTLKVTDNRVRVAKDESVTFEVRNGRVIVTAPASDRYISQSSLLKMRAVEPNFASGGRLTILDTEVIAPGKVKILGMWPSPEVSVVITELGVSFVSPSWPTARTFYNGTFEINDNYASVFGFGP